MKDALKNISENIPLLLSGLHVPNGTEVLPERWLLHAITVSIYNIYVLVNRRSSDERKSIDNQHHHVVRKFRATNCFTAASSRYIHAANFHRPPSAWSGVRGSFLATGIRWLAPVHRVSVLLWSPRCVAKQNMMTAPGAVRASQLIPEQAIGCRPVAVTRFPSRAPSVRGLLWCEQRRAQGESGGDKRGAWRLNVEEVMLPYEASSTGSLLLFLMLDVVMEDSAWCPTHQRFTKRQCAFVRGFTLRKLFRSLCIV